MRRTLPRVFALAILQVAALAGCFSEKGPTDNTNLPGECRFSPSSTVPGTTVVAIRNLTFAPAEVRIRTGGTVTWVNCEEIGAETHTSTADQGQWSSPSIPSGAVYSLTFAQPGRFTYHCVPHPSMTAAVVVE